MGQSSRFVSGKAIGSITSELRIRVTEPKRLPPRLVSVSRCVIRRLVIVLYMFRYYGDNIRR
jgi:hypothetical protein